MARLKLAMSRYAHTAPLIDGEVRPNGIELDIVDVTGKTNATFRSMSRELAFDVSELGISTAYSAKEVGVPFTPIPVFVTRRFDHEAMYYNADSGITTPKDLEGKRVGLRSYTVTDVIWSRGILSDLYGVDHDAITWVVTGDEHIAGAPLPPNSELLPGADLAQLVESGEVAAIINPYRGDAPNVLPLIADRDATERAWIEQKGAISMHHVVVVKDSVLESDPNIARELYRAFVEAKQPMLDRIEAGKAPTEVTSDGQTGFEGLGVQRTEELVRPDPMPYGLEQNRSTLEAFTQYAVDQRLISRPISLEELFAAV